MSAEQEAWPPDDSGSGGDADDAAAGDSRPGAPEPGSEAEGEALRSMSIELLEFPRVREMLAGQARFFLSRSRALDVMPSADPAVVAELQEETAEAALMLDIAGDLGLAGMDDPRPLVRRAALDGTLKGVELLKLGYLFEAVWSARRVVESTRGRTPRLQAIATGIADLRDLKARISEALDDQGQVVDSATPRLGPLRAEAATAYNRLVRLLERTAASSEVRGALQSHAIATRGDRLVLEVKSEHRRSLPGIVHDVSHTGMTLFVEPFQAVERCNEWRELAAEAIREEERVLRKLSRMVGDRERDAMESMEAAAGLDLITARARLARAMQAHRPETLPPGSAMAVRLAAARHPLLGEGAVPVSLHIGPDFRQLVITGPNTGGKTVALKTAGLVALMHQAGMQAPAEDGSALAVFDGVYADIGDAQSIERSVSTFSSHMGNVVRVLRHATARSLVLLDELGTGTDPEEGSALARAVLGHLVARSVPGAITTHHRQVAEYAGATAGMKNASVELDPETMSPTYHVVMGVPGRSYAMHVASRLGLPEEVLARAREFIDPQHRQAESLLNQLQRERDELRRAGVAAQEELTKAETMRRELQARLSQISRQQEDLVERTRMELRREADEVRHELRRVVEEAKQSANVAVARAAVNRMRQTLAEPSWFPIAAQEPPPGTPTEAPQEPDRPVQAGDTVEIKGLGVRAEVLAVGTDGMADLQMGGVKVQLKTGQLRRVAAGPPPAPDAPRISLKPAGPPEPLEHELDMRGARAIEAHDVVTAYLDRCAVSGLSVCRIIHGTGTGALREAVRETLAASSHVKSFRTAAQNEGGNGATVVELA
jgi:DNA mismatch repair protein MutS2